MTLTVLSVAYSLATVGPAAVGGAEQVLTRLDEALVARGHASIVVAPEGSRTRGVLRATPRPPATLDDRAREGAWRAQREAVLDALARHPVDVVHLHGIDFHRYLPPAGVPVLVTLHLPPAWYAPEAFALQRPDTYLHCVSASQRRACPPHARLLPTIENGVSVERFVPARRKRDYVVALGRICPEKGYHLALDAARAAGARLLLAGRVFGYPAHERYFREEIAPRLDRRRRFIGAVDFERKRRLLARARCLLVPSLAPETSSLVAMEALAAGTPVIAFATGALTDIVEHGVTGFLVRDAREMRDAIEAASTLRPEACRAAAWERFSSERMVLRYLETYAWLAAPPAETTACVA